ncbi:uncharacterized protein LOC135494319 [Lineus longissimus]|uniref:uncharacterized protein LOC135494319 n=1 Tax=Lineus longissimus TaxID=88925 RepID=UPI00315CBB9E
MGRSEVDRKIEKLIVEVEKNPGLYDKSSELFKDALKKDDIWRTILDRVGFNSVKEVKQKWKTVRDNYRRYLNATKTKSGQAAKAVTQYKYAGLLEFLKPSLDDRETTSNLGQDTQELDEVDDDGIAAEEDARSSDCENEDISVSVASASSVSRSSTPTPFRNPSASSSKKRKSKDEFDEVVSDFFSEKKKQLQQNRNVPLAQPKEELDDIDRFMKSMGDIVRTLPARAVADIKFKIHGIVHEAQMRHVFPADEVHFNRHQKSASNPVPAFQSGQNTSQQFGQRFGSNQPSPSCTVSRPMTTNESQQQWSLL